MKLQTIRNRVIKIIDDKSFDPITLNTYINKALYDCTDLIDVPEFKKVFTVSTEVDSGFISLRDKITNYGGRLKRVKYNGSDLIIRSSLEDLLDDFDNLTDSGDISTVAIEGPNLWYAKIPETSVELLVLCYENPEPLSRDNDEILWMPESVQEKILVQGAAAYAWELIEEEDSGYPVMKRYRRGFDSGITDLRIWISKNRRNITHSCWSY